MNKMKKAAFFLLLFILGISVIAQVIPENRRVDWSVAGIKTDIPDPGTIVNVLNYGGSNNGTTDNKDAVVDAINSLNGDAGVIYFPAGVYMFNSGFSLAENVILRGDGPKESLLMFLFSEGQNAISVSGSSTGNNVDIVSGNEMGSTQITVSNSSSFSAGDYAEITQNNGSWDTNPADWAVRVVGQIVKITGVLGNVISIENPLRLDYDLSLSLTMRKIVPIKNAGIENLGLETVLDAGVAGHNITFNYAAECWVKNIESNKSVGSHIYIGRSTNIEVSDSYIYEAFTFTGVGTRGYGVTLSHQTGECLIENNIFRYLRHAMMVKAGANGNVFAYNYSIDPNRSENPSDLGGDISLHGHYPFSNLFEGNIVQNIFPDNYWGPNGPYNTIFRNRAELYGIIMDTDSVDASNSTSRQNFVGNEISNMFLFMGLYVLTGDDHFTYANNVRGAINPPGTEDLNDNSYYLSAEPAFWDINDNWPSIGLPNTLNSGTIPAKERYINMISGIDRNVVLLEAIKVYPNPVIDDRIILNIGENKFRNIDLRIYNNRGVEVYRKSYQNILNNDIIIEEDFKAGIYYISVYTNNLLFASRKLIVI